MFRMPDLGEGLTEATVITWFVKVGDEIDVDQVLVEVDTGKTVVEIPSPFRGTITSILTKEGETVDVDAVLYVVDGDSSQAYEDSTPHTPRDKPTPDAGVPPQTGPEQPTGSVRPRAMPIVRKLARDLGIALDTVVGSGPNGSVTREDVTCAATPQKSLTESLVELSQTRRAIARHMSESWATIPHVTVQADIQADSLMALRSTRRSGLYPLEVLVASAIAPILLGFPEFNGRFVDGSLASNTAIHFGFAVDTSAGLVVVVVKDADQMDVDTLTERFESLAAAAQSRTIAADELTGQTFTISNIGALGGGHGTPIIPLGTSAIVSIGRAKPQPVVTEDGVGVGLVAPLDLSYDHRLIDGALGQRFLSALTTALE